MNACQVLGLLVATFGKQIENDEEINGGDAVESIVEMYFLAKEALGKVEHYQVEDICARLLDSEEHACESAVPQVAEEAVVLIRALGAEICRLQAAAAN